MKECNSIKQSPIAALAAYGGGAGGTTFTGGSTEKVYVDDVFSTYVYEGQNTSTNTINNGLDLAGEGGLVWIKRRDGAAVNHYLFDTERTNKYLNSNNDSGQFDAAASSYINSYTSTGFVTGDSGNIGWQDNFVSWSFRKAPGFFDVVTYTGTGSARTVAHNLGSVPGMILIKCTSEDKDWSVYHRSLGATKNMHLNNNSVADTQTGVFNDTEPTATNFTVNYDGDVNKNGATYVAYVFAHDEQSFGTDSDEAIIKCGGFTHSSSSGNEIDLGFEPQWILYKPSDGTVGWYIWDTMRGWNVSDQSNLRPDVTNTESTGDNSSAGWPQITNTGFKLGTNSFAGDNKTFIYMAIRRPNKPPEAATNVFAIDTFTGSTPNYISNFIVDFYISRSGGGINVAGNDQEVGSRLLGPKFLKASSNAVPVSSSATVFDYMNGFQADSGSASNVKYAWMFKRAPGFLDVVTYDGNSQNSRTVNHNLGTAPKLILIKSTSSNYDWIGWSTGLTSSKYLVVNSTAAEASGAYVVSSSTSNFTLNQFGEVNGNGEKYIAYLFDTLNGISKVGTYTGTGNDLNVDCGFSSGARFILIKRTDSSGGWYLYDSVRGISSGNDPYLLLNSDAAQVTNTDYIDPLNAGFTVTSSAPAELNTNGGTYLFLAVA